VGLPALQAPKRMAAPFGAAAGEAGVGARGRAESDRGLHLLEVVGERCAHPFPPA